MIISYTQLETLAKEQMPWLKDSRREHIVRCTITAVGLAKRFGADEDIVCIAAFYHDYAKGREDELMQLYGDEVAEYADSYDTMHAPLGALIVRDEIGITDTRVLNCIKNHCTGKPDMTKEEKIVFIADAIEPGRDYPGVELMRTTAEKDLDKAVYLYCENLVSYLTQQNKQINALSLQCRDYYKNKVSGVSSKDLADKIVHILYFHKGEGIVCLNVQEQTFITDYLVVCGSGTATHCRALCDYVTDELAKHGIEPEKTEGYNDGKWVIMDYNGVMVHIMRNEEREFYRLERLWENGTNIVKL